MLGLVCMNNGLLTSSHGLLKNYIYLSLLCWSRSVGHSFTAFVCINVASQCIALQWELFSLRCRSGPKLYSLQCNMTSGCDASVCVCVCVCVCCELVLKSMQFVNHWVGIRPHLFTCVCMS